VINFINVASPQSGIWYVGRRYYEYISKFTMTQWHDLKWNHYTYDMLKNLVFRETTAEGITMLVDDRITPINSDNQIMIMHDFFKDSFLPNRIKKEVNIYLMREYRTKVITVSEHIEVESIKRGLKVIGTLYPYYYAKFPYNNREYFDNNKKENLILSIGNNDKRKRNDIIADFLNKLPQDYFAIRIGSPIPISKRFLYADKIKEDTLRNLYGSAKYLIFPSEDEGLGLPMIEALFHNVVVIANEKNPILKEFNYPEIIVPEKEGDFYIPDYPDIGEFGKFRQDYMQKIASQHIKIAKYLDLPDDISAFEISQIAMGGDSSDVRK